MRRHLLYLVGTVGVAFLAALLIALVVEPRLAGPLLTGRLRQLSALVSLMLVGSCGYLMFCWLRYTIATHHHLLPEPDCARTPLRPADYLQGQRVPVMGRG